MKNLLLIIILLVSSLNVFTQDFEKTFSLEISVIESSTSKIIEGALIKVTGSDGSIWESTTDSSGKMINACPLKKNSKYNVIVKKEGYADAKGRETTKGLKNSFLFLHEYKLHPIE